MKENNSAEKSAATFAFLDSGTGGIPYMLALKERRPESKCVYLGDTVHFPYGEKPVEEIARCAASAVSLIIKKWNPETLIIACNTISVTALNSLRSLFPKLPIVGTVPAVKLAAKVTRNKKIGFLATTASVNSPYSQKLIDSFASDCEVYRRGDPALVNFVEKDFFTATKEQRLNAVKPAVDFFASKGCDTIILGCTHFTHVAQDIQEASGSGVKVIDSRDGVSRQAIKVERAKTGRVRSLDSGSASQTETCGMPFKDMSFFVTAATSSEEREYRTLCAKLNIPWGGIV